MYIVPTPVGNLEDITLRAIRILKEADAILAEDTRQTVKLLKHYNIHTPLWSYHQHNEHKQLEQLVMRLESGITLALVSDAGTPGISDPGFLLIRAAIEKGIEVQTLPGATAFVPALVSSGLPCNEFVFVGFLPQKKGRQTAIKALAVEKRTIVMYESPYRLCKTLEQLATTLGAARNICVSREISKIYEEHKRGTLEELCLYYKKTPPKGEVVLCINGLED